MSDKQISASRVTMTVDGETIPIKDFSIGRISVEDGKAQPDKYPMVYYEVWKVPTSAMDYDHYEDLWANGGIFPKGSLLARCRTDDRAEEIKSILEEDSPIEHFANDAGEATYKFVIEERLFEEDK